MAWGEGDNVHRLFGDHGHSNCEQFTPDSGLLALVGAPRQKTGSSASFHTFVRIHRVVDGFELATLDDSNSPYPFDSPWFSPDGKIMVTSRQVWSENGGPPSNVLSWWNTATWRLSGTVTSPFNSLAWSPDSRTAAVVVFVAGDGYRLVLRNFDGSAAGDLGHVDVYPAQPLAFSSDGRRIAVGGGGDTLRGTRRGRIQLFEIR